LEAEGNSRKNKVRHGVRERRRIGRKREEEKKGRLRRERGGKRGG